MDKQNFVDIQAIAPNLNMFLNFKVTSFRNISICRNLEKKRWSVSLR